MKTKTKTVGIVVGTRGSKLALIQTGLVVSKIKSLYPDLDITVEEIVTAGDRDRKTHLDRLGVAVFVKELEEALLDGRIDMAVHSLKDVPTDLPDALCLIATPERADPRDVLIGRSGFKDMPSGARIATDSLRRLIQIKRIRPDLQICAIRGNVDTRVRKALSGEVDGVVLAAAGILRLGWAEKITEYLPADSFLPAVGQGALVIEARRDDKELAALISQINDAPTWQSVTAERTFLKALGGGCRAPIAALGVVADGRLLLRGMAGSMDGRQSIYSLEEGRLGSATEVGERLAQKLLALGAAQFIDEAVRIEQR